MGSTFCSVIEAAVTKGETRFEKKGVYIFNQSNILKDEQQTTHETNTMQAQYKTVWIG